ncbi:aryl-alcohol dehydrogenase-like predicted oxidoreductase [Hymenobacter luteus]|uniref:Aryl-alcohol dehydrogenase-like predicted oxidoreductase n=2 Tax=Hymenobacter TaxID=89966 RepID=A0A7W9T1T8_9BACT|nr:MULTISPECIES: aldo/keto reductase [Hymenobacter]MBB4602113.1 aryl-alcohol dehydrogenase-like predicted oxidoreductase [Hymenobacter latericoloratus]MBB6059458.1 aryl-alcohol dehydrogenase-like predicted oxidoreductase [Hymenobacter luteus]
MSTITIAPNSAHPLTVSRLGYGTMRLTGPEIWGEPANRPEALQILRTAVEAGVTFLDTADYYGQDVTNRLIREALFPYPSNLVICTKVGATRRSDKSWVPFNRPEQLRQSIENNLRTLGQEQIQLVHLRLMGPGPVPLDEQLGAMFELQREGKILHVGLSNVTRAELEAGLRLGPIATVENMYSYAQRTTVRLPHGANPGGEEVLDLCEQHQLPLIPFFSLVHALPKALDKIAEVARQHNATPAQINIAWLLHRSPWLLPIPGTSSLAHLRENLAAAVIQLSPADMAYLG